MTGAGTTPWTEEILRAFGGTDNIHADCTLDNGPVVVRQTTI